MEAPALQRLVEEADYLAAERDAETRHEYVDGVLFAMTGASRTHNRLATNLTVALGTHLRGGPRRLASSDMKVRLAEGRRYYYPDIVVSRSEASEEPDDYTETRPVLIVEILSPSTEATDRREKRLAYQTLPRACGQSPSRRCRNSFFRPQGVVREGSSLPDRATTQWTEK